MIFTASVTITVKRLPEALGKLPLKKTRLFLSAFFPLSRHGLTPSVFLTETQVYAQNICRFALLKQK